ncbi:MAG: AraC family transcriptional regulator [Puniceicoccales bacterium]
MKQQQPAAAHDHNYLELAFVMGGRARHLTVHGAETCGAGEVFVIPVGAWHAYSDCRSLELYNCLLSPSLLRNELGWLAGDLKIVPLLGFDSRGLESGVRKLDLPRGRLKRLRALLEALNISYRREAPRMELLGHLLLLLSSLRNFVPDTEAKAQPMHSAVLKAIDFLNRDITHEWTLTELATKLKLSPPYFVRLFRSTTGRTPMSYLESLRAEQAATLLASTQLRVGEVGERVGWPEPKHFARVFKRHFGKSATAYRTELNLA